MTIISIFFLGAFFFSSINIYGQETCNRDANEALFEVGGCEKSEYIVLQKRITLKSQLNQENTTYVIKRNFNLNGEKVTVPLGCKLIFDGGCIDGGILEGSNTKIVVAKKNAFGDNLLIEGSWITESVDDLWFTSTDFKKVFRNMHRMGVTLLFNKDYKEQEINTSIMIDHSLDMDFHGHTLSVKSRNLDNNRGGSCWMLNSAYLKDSNEKRCVTIRNINVESVADNRITKDGNYFGSYSGLNFFLCRDLDTVRFDNVRTKNIDYCVRVGGEYDIKSKNIGLLSINNCYFDSSIMSVFIKNTDKVSIYSSYFNNGNQNSTLLHCIYAFEGIKDMMVESCRFDKSLSSVNFGTTDTPSNPINKVRITNCVFNCATNGSGSVGSWYESFTNDLVFENCIVNNQSYKINGNAKFRNCYIKGTLKYHYHFIQGASFDNCVFDMKMGVDHQYGVTSGNLNNCEVNINCDGHTIYYLIDSQDEHKGTKILNTIFNFSNTLGDLFLFGAELDNSVIEVNNMTVNYPDDINGKHNNIRVLGRSKAIKTKGLLFIDGLYLNKSSVNYYYENANYSNMKKVNSINVFSNGKKQVDIILERD